MIIEEKGCLSVSPHAYLFKGHQRQVIRWNKNHCTEHQSDCPPLVDAK